MTDALNNLSNAFWFVVVLLMAIGLPTMFIQNWQSFVIQWIGFLLVVPATYLLFEGIDQLIALFNN